MTYSKKATPRRVNDSTPDMTVGTCPSSVSTLRRSERTRTLSSKAKAINALSHKENSTSHISFVILLLNGSVGTSKGKKRSRDEDTVDGTNKVKRVKLDKNISNTTKMVR